MITNKKYSFIHDAKKAAAGLGLALAAALMLAGCSNRSQSAAPNNTTGAANISESQPSSSETYGTETEPLDLQPLMAAPITFTDVDEVVYTTAIVNIRDGAGMDANVVSLAPKGAPIRRTGYESTWSRVDIEGQTCYMASAYLTATPPAAQETSSVSNETGASSSTGTVYGEGDFVVAIDPGHQRKANSEKEPVGPGASEMKAKVTGGATGVSTGQTEYELNLQVALKLRDELVSRGYKVIMIRETHDVNLSNKERADIANESGAQAFVRIHANSADASSAKGALTMCPTAKNPYVAGLHDKSLLLSQSILDQICASTGARNRGVTQTDTMSGINWSKIPVTIVEMGFLSNSEEDKSLADTSYQDKMVKGMADGLDLYFGK